MNFNILQKEISIIEKGKRAGSSRTIIGKQLCAVGLPTTSDGLVDLVGSKIGFEASYDGDNWFTVNNPEGKKFEIPAAIPQEVVKIPNLTNNPPAVIPIGNPAPFKGLLAIRPVSNAEELKNVSIDLWFEVLPG